MVTREQLKQWCSVGPDELVDHPDLRTPFRLVEDTAAMGELMARELVDLILARNGAGRTTRLIIPCGPACWYAPYTQCVNEERMDLTGVTVFHMDECLDWQGRELPRNHPYNFRAFMEEHFYGGIPGERNVPVAQRYFPNGRNNDDILEAMAQSPIDLCMGGWGQDGHVAYNQTRRHPFSAITLEELRQSTLRIQDNNLDTVITLGQRTFGAAYQFVPPMSVTLGMKECLGAKKVRVFSDTGAWKQTALRVALFSEETVEYPITLLQSHPDALITATRETASHPVGEHPEWELF